MRILTVPGRLARAILRAIRGTGRAIGRIDAEAAVAVLALALLFVGVAQWSYGAACVVVAAVLLAWLGFKLVTLALLEALRLRLTLGPSRRGGE